VVKDPIVIKLSLINLFKKLYNLKMTDPCPVNLEIHKD